MKYITRISIYLLTLFTISSGSAGEIPPAVTTIMSINGEITENFQGQSAFKSLNIPKRYWGTSNISKRLNYWPTCGVNGTILYYTREGYIYSVNLRSAAKQEALVAKGLFPSVSLNGALLAFYKHPNKLNVMSVATGEIMATLPGIYGYSPAVWISKDELVYQSIDNKLILYNLSTSALKDLGIAGLVPSSLSPDEKMLACLGTEAHGIFLLDLLNMTVSPLIQKYFLSFGPSAIWSGDGKSIIYSRQTWAHKLCISEGRDLFSISVEDKTENKLLNNIVLWGGVNVKASN